MIRHFLARFRRKTKCYSKSIEMMGISLNLLMAKRNNLISMLTNTPCISTKVYGYPHEEAAKIALIAIFKHIESGKYKGDSSFAVFLKEDAEFMRIC